MPSFILKDALGSGASVSESLAFCLLNNKLGADSVYNSVLQLVVMLLCVQSLQSFCYGMVTVYLLGQYLRDSGVAG